EVFNQTVSLLLDADGRMLRGKCNCSHHFRGGLRKGPCRHLQALRTAAISQPAPSSLEAWFKAARDWCQP
ncbi:metal-binding protein, partial [Singulisphaera rosea]